MNPIRSSRVLPLLVFAVACLGCRSMQHFTCDNIAESQPRNFGEVKTASGAPTGIYRGAQPKTCAEIAFLKKLGITTIVKLNDDRAPIDKAEKREAESQGIHVEPFSMSPATIGSEKTCDAVRSILAILTEAAGKKIYVHCSAGRDRTGYIIGLFEEAVLNKPVHDVLEELAEYGHRGYPVLLYPNIRRQLRLRQFRCLHSASLAQ